MSAPTAAAAAGGGSGGGGGGGGGRRVDGGAHEREAGDFAAALHRTPSVSALDLREVAHALRLVEQNLSRVSRIFVSGGGEVITRRRRRKRGSRGGGVREIDGTCPLNTLAFQIDEMRGF